jgi:hypothetical protein
MKELAEKDCGALQKNVKEPSHIVVESEPEPEIHRSGLPMRRIIVYYFTISANFFMTT